MTTAIDTNVITALWNAEDALHRAAQQALDGALGRGKLVISGTVHAELSAAPSRSGEFVDRFCEETGVAVEWDLGEKIWRAAGVAFGAYATRRRRQRSAEARRTLADFVIGAHAAVRGYRLLTLDSGVYAAAFPGLVVVSV